MSGPTLQRKVTVTNPQGFHMRPAAAFATLARKYQCDVHVIKEEQRVNGKSPLELLLLVALPGSELTIEACGADAPEALDALVEVVNSVAEEDTPAAPSERDS
jgi:phosphotransferase system HPr (HPr) family protein